MNKFQMLILTIRVIAVMIVGLLATAFLTLSERKVMAACQRRKGPNVVGFIGLLQPIADGLYSTKCPIVWAGPYRHLQQ